MKRGLKTTALALLLSCGAALPAAAESLYQEGSFRPLTADNKAFRIGDSLTIQVFQNSSASSSADSQIGTMFNAQKRRGRT